RGPGGVGVRGPSAQPPSRGGREPPPPERPPSRVPRSAHPAPRPARTGRDPGLCGTRGPGAAVAGARAPSRRRVAPRHRPPAARTRRAARLRGDQGRLGVSRLHERPPRPLLLGAGPAGGGGAPPPVRRPHVGG